MRDGGGQREKARPLFRAGRRRLGFCHARLRRPARPARADAPAHHQAAADDGLFPRHARPRPGLCAGGADRRPRHRQRQAGDAARAGGGAGGRGALRLFLRLCRRPRRDDLADLAGGGRSVCPGKVKLQGRGGADDPHPAGVASPTSPFQGEEKRQPPLLRTAHLRWPLRGHLGTRAERVPGKKPTHRGSPRSSSGCRRRRARRGRGWWRAGSTGSTPPDAGR